MTQKSCNYYDKQFKITYLNVLTVYFRTDGIKFEKQTAHEEDHMS